MTDKSFVSYRKDIVKISNNNTSKANEVIDYDEAEKIVVDYLSERKILEMTVNDGALSSNRNLTKADLRAEKERCRKFVSDCILQKNISVRGYSGEKLNDFINDMVSEYSGYSVLEDAFNDPDVDDIYCLAWNKIYVERAGKNVKYEKTFRSKEHYKDVVERFIRKAGKEINIGDSKIVDFELYGDRGCATSPAVSPKDYSMTLRKHREDHIMLDDLLYGGVLNEEISEFFGLTIDGESNIIYAGITGTGKTTTIRALIDHYVTLNNKRMLVCEDTQELFPKNDHTLELVSCRAEDPKADIPLYKLIITALRLKPKYIVVGEVRAEEAQAAVEGMETGHSTIFTMHAGKPINAINRLVTKYLMMMPALGIDVVERIIGSAVDFIAVQDNIEGIGRKVTYITEVEFDDVQKRTKLTDLMLYDFMKEDWVWYKRIAPEKCRNLMRRGVPKSRVIKWMETDDPEVEKKAIDELNETYYREKAERQERYNKEHEEKMKARELARMKKREENTSSSVNAALVSELNKVKEIEDMQRRTQKLQKFVSINERNNEDGDNKDSE